jgi:two-component system nitrogen regulation response regulator GlnG
VKVFFIDDEEVNLKLIEMLGKQHTNIEQQYFLSYDPVHSELKEGNIPDLIVTDIRMPGIDGFEVVKMVHQFDPNIKLMYCSAFSSLKTALAEKELSEDDYLLRPYYVKPIRADIFDEIKKLLG